MRSSRVLRAASLAAVVPLLAAASAARAWVPDGTPVAASDTADSGPALAADGTGGVYVAWSSTREWRPALRIVRLDSTGDPAPGWTAGGRMMSSWAYDAHLVADGAGGVAAAWIEKYPSVLLAGLGVGRIGPDGAGAPRLAAAPAEARSRIEPREIAKYPTGATMPSILPDAGGAWIAWCYADRFDEYVRLTRRALDGLVVGTDPFGGQTWGYRPRLCSDGDGGAFVSWGPGVLLRRVLRSGAFDPSWPAAATIARHPAGAGEVVADGAGGAYLAWLEPRPGGGQRAAILRVTASGAPAPGWPAAGRVIGSHPCLPGSHREGPDPRYDQVHMSMVADGAGGALIAWQDQRDDAGDVYVQRVLADGGIAPGWPEEGVGAGVASGAQSLPVLVADGAGGALVAWQDGRRPADLDVYGQHVLADGTLLPGAARSGIALCTAAGAQTLPRIVADGRGGAIVAWTDARGGQTDVYATRLGFGGVVGVAFAALPASATEEEVRIEWDSRFRPGASAALERRETEAAWRPIATLEADSRGRFAHVDRDVVPGRRYGYRLARASGTAAELGPEIEVEVPWAPRLAVERVQPNPAAGAWRVELSVAEAAPTRLELWDAQGRLIERSLLPARPGWHTTILGAARLPAGVYWIRLVSGERSRSARVVRVE